MFSWRKLKWVTIALLALATILILCANLWVVISTEDKVFTDINALDGHDVALVLGTSKKLSSGASNSFFENRIKAAADLFRDGKISHFIVSGDNRTLNYNEPMEMKKALIQLGVPDSAITLDYAGLIEGDGAIRDTQLNERLLRSEEH